MSETFADRLVSAIDAKQAPICVGIDPILDLFPEQIFMRGGAPRSVNDDTTAAIDAIYTFTTKVLKVVAPHVPCVKFQSAYFERYLWEGVEAYYSLIHEAKELGLLVIGDVKRGDIGATSTATAPRNSPNSPNRCPNPAPPTRSTSIRCSALDRWS